MGYMGKNVSRKYQKIRYDKANFTNKQIRDLSDLIDTYFNINELYLIDQYRYMRKHGEPELYYEWLKRFKVENFYYLCEGRITVDNISKTILTTILGYTYMSLSFLPHNDKLYPTNYKSSDKWIVDVFRSHRFDRYNYNNLHIPINGSKRIDKMIREKGYLKIPKFGKLPFRSDDLEKISEHAEIGTCWVHVNFTPYISASMNYKDDDGFIKLIRKK